MVSLDLDLRRTFQSVLLSALRTADAAETEEGWRRWRRVDCRMRSRPIQASAPNRRYRPDPVVSSPSCAFFFFSGALQKRISLFASGGISHHLLLRFPCRRKLFHLSVCFAPMLRLRRWIAVDVAPPRRKVPADSIRWRPSSLLLSLRLIRVSRPTPGLVNRFVRWFGSFHF